MLHTFLNQIWVKINFYYKINTIFEFSVKTYCYAAGFSIVGEILIFDHFCAKKWKWNFRGRCFKQFMGYEVAPAT